MSPFRIFRNGKQTFCEWYFESGKPHGRILNQGQGKYLENEFSSLEEAKHFCEKQLEKDVSLLMYIMQGDDIINSVQNNAYQKAQAKKVDRLYAAASLALVLLIAFVVSFLVMPFETITSHAMFIGGARLFYLLLFMIAGSWHLENVLVTLLLLILLTVLIPLFSRG